MILVNLDSFEKAKTLVDICDRYSPDVKVDAIYGNYVVDAASILGMQQFIAKNIKLDVISYDENKVNRFTRELEENGVI